MQTIDWKLDNIIPQSSKEQSILDDIRNLASLNLSISSLKSELKDDPDSYSYDEDDLDQFLFANKLY